MIHLVKDFHSKLYVAGSYYYEIRVYLQISLYLIGILFGSIKHNKWIAASATELIFHIHSSYLFPNLDTSSVVMSILEQNII